MLRLEPNEHQVGVMAEFYTQEGSVHAQEVEGQHLAAAFALQALWFLLTVDGARVTVIADTRPHGKDFMGLMYAMSRRNFAVDSVCAWPTYRVMKIAGDEPREARLVGLLPAYFEDRTADNHLFIAINAGCTEPDYVDTLQAIEHEAAGHPGARIAYLW